MKKNGWIRLQYPLRHQEIRLRTTLEVFLKFIRARLPHRVHFERPRPFPRHHLRHQQQLQCRDRGQQLDLPRRKRPALSIDHFLDTAPLRLISLTICSTSGQIFKFWRRTRILCFFSDEQCEYLPNLGIREVRIWTVRRTEIHPLKKCH